MVKKKQTAKKEIVGSAGDTGEGKLLEEAPEISEERYRTILEQMYDHYYEVDLAGNFTFVNQSTCRNLGYAREELIGKSYRLTVPEDDIKRLFAASNEVFRSGEPNKGYSHSILRKDGSIFFAESSIDIRRNKQGEIIGFRTVSRDITERKLAEEALRVSEQRFREFFEQEINYCYRISLDGTILDLNSSALRVLGYASKDEIVGKPLLTTVYSPASRERAHQLFLRWKEIGELHNEELSIISQSGEERIVILNVHAVRDIDGKLLHSVSVQTDITGRKRAEEALRESEERFRRLSENAPDVIYRYRLKPLPGYEYVSPASAKILGYTPEEWYADPLLARKIVHPEDQNQYEQHFRSLRSLGIPLTLRWIHKDGHVTWAEEIDVPVYAANGELIAYEGIIRNITDRKRVEVALRESEEKYRRLVENAQEAIFVAVDGVLKFANSMTAVLSGYSQDELASRPFIEFVHPDDRQMVRHLQRLKDMDVPNIYTFRIICKPGDIKWVELSEAFISWEGRPAALNFLTDITDRKRLEMERQRVEKLESVGMLAGGIAHDFNNILTAILGNINLAGKEAAPGSEIQNSLEQVEKAALRGKDLTRQLLAFAKGGAPVKKIVSLTELLRDTAVFALRSSKVKCHFSIPDGLWQAGIDAGQVSQVIHNLVINAQQAMPSGGTIELTAENIALSEMQSLGGGLPVKEGNYVRVAVTDHGSGIAAEHLAKIFAPFFTTRQKSSGLGLATAFSIARQHGGHLSVKSEVGAGSTFYLYLPASTQTVTPKQDQKEAIKAAGKAGILVMATRILVMDDEQGVREVAGRMLGNIGYQDVEFAANGAEAVKLYKAALESGRPFGVAILDLTIAGGMGGEVAIRKLLKIDPGVKAIVSSGYIDDPVIANYKEYGFSGMVAKPYTLAELGKVLHAVIG
jgi:PAS domain S-box-containing protein